jgi:hypothetical protein
VENKKEWTVRGGDIVRELIAKIHKKNEMAAIATGDDEKKNEQKEQQLEKEKKPDPDKHLVEWNADLFKRMLRQVLAHRMAEGQECKEGMLSLANTMKEGSTVRDEITRIIDLPLFDKKTSKLKVDPDSIELSKAVEDQLRDYVSFIASMYRDNQFHNFKHASNVTMGANKLLSRKFLFFTAAAAGFLSLYPFHPPPQALLMTIWPCNCLTRLPKLL